MRTLLFTLAFSLSLLAQDTKHPALDLDLDSAAGWIRDPEVMVDTQQVGASFQLRTKVDRAALLDQALARAKSENKPVLWYVYRIIEKKTLQGRQMYRAPVLDLYMQHAVFADPDVAGIVAARFVPLRMICDEALAERFALRPLDVVEPMLVVLSAEGKVLHVLQRIRTFSAHWTADVLRRILARVVPEAAAMAQAAAIQDAETALRQGYYERALELLEQKQEKKAEDHLALAGVYRRLRKPEQALAALERIETKNRALLGAVALEHGLLAMHQDKPLEAIPELEKAWRTPRLPRAAEAGYWLAVNALRCGDEARATKVFAQVADKARDDAFGKKARANLVLGPDERPLGATLAGFESVTWMQPEAYTGLPKDTALPGQRQPREIAKAALEHLLKQQRDSGGFCDSRYAYWPNPEITPNVWVAVTAIAASALLEWRELDPQRIDQALTKAELFMFGGHHLARGKNEDVYADSYRLIYLARKATAFPEQKPALIARMNEVVQDAARRQFENGFWAHEYQNAFATGAMLWGAHVARGAGADVPPLLIEKGATALLAARFKNGAFTYGGSAPQEREENEGPASRPGQRRPRAVGSLKDSSARMPLCEGTLLALGKSDEARLTFAFQTYWEYMGRQEAVRRNDYHSDGELAGFFFLYDLFHASETNKLLPAAAREVNEQKFLALIQRIGEIDGSFVDSHELGKSYATGMALLALKNVAH